MEVREQGSGRPVPRASVLFLWKKYASAALGGRCISSSKYDPLRLLEQKSRRAVSNSRGVAVLHVGPGWGDLLVTAGAGSLFGWTIVKAWQSRASLPVGSCPDLAVRIERADGKPAWGVRVGLKGAILGQRYIIRRLTGRDGKAVFEKAPFLVDPGKTGRSSRAEVFVDEPLGVRVEDGVSFKETGWMPLVLRLPPSGRLAVRVLCEGRPVRNGMAVVRLEEGRRVIARREVDGRGLAFFKYVGLGMKFGVRASPLFFEPREIRKDAARVRGPAKAGERVDVEVSLAEKGRYLSGSLLGPAGMPLSQEWVHWEVSSKGDAPAGYVEIRDDLILTDRLGRFLLPLFRFHPRRDPFAGDGGESRPPSGKKPGWWIHFAAFPREMAPWTEYVWVQGRISPGTYKAGKIRLSPASLLAEGRVMEGWRKPLVGARITAFTLARTRIRDEGERGKAGSAGGGKEKRFRETRKDLLGGWTYSGSGGRFQVWGDAGEETVYLEVVHPRSHKRKVFSIRPGVRDMKILVKE